MSIYDRMPAIHAHIDSTSRPTDKALKEIVLQPFFPSKTSIFDVNWPSITPIMSYSFQVLFCWADVICLIIDSPLIIQPPILWDD